MRTLPVGAEGTFTMVVGPEHLANRFKDAMLPPVLSTPVMIMMMENAALNAMKPYFDANETAVGSRVDVVHVAPTLQGRTVTARAKVTSVDGRRVEFAVEAAEGDKAIGFGTHERSVIDLKRFSARLAAGQESGRSSD